MIEKTLDIFESFMPEAEVSIRTAVHLLRHPGFEGLANVEIQKSTIIKRDADRNKVTFPTEKLLKELNLQRIPLQQILHKNEPEWFGEYSLDEKHLKIQRKECGLGDVVGFINKKRIRIECKGGYYAPLSERVSDKNSKKLSNSTEYAALWSVLGQIVATERVADNDIMAVAVPLNSAYKKLIEKFQNRPFIAQLGIKFLLVSKDGTIKGFEQLVS